MPSQAYHSLPSGRAGGGGQLLLGLLLFLFTSCTDWLDYKPKDRQTEEQQFATKDGFNSAVNGVYNQMNSSSLYGAYLSYSFIDILGQYYMVDMDSEGSFYDYQRALIKWDYTQEGVVGALNAIWGKAYSLIMNINVVLSNIENDRLEKHVLSESDYQMLKGEMLACRAMLHFDLLRLFGPVYCNNPQGRGIPYNESMETEILPILNADDVLNNHILRDLREAESLLQASDPVIEFGPRAEYDDINYDNSMRYRQLRLNYYATVLLTARAYLWAGDHTKALAEAKKLTDDPKVREFFPVVNASKLLANTTDPDRMFTSECLFGFYNKDRGQIYDYTFGGENTGKSLLIPRSGYVDGLLFGSNETGDYRYQSHWDNGQALNEEPSKKLVKFKKIADKGRDDAEGNVEKDEESVLAAMKFYGTFSSIMKLSEAYLIAAECLGTPESAVYDASSALDYINAERRSRGLGNLSASTSDDEMKRQITLEYIREFVGEGQKFFYFKRRNMGFDNEYSGRQEVKVLITPANSFFPAVYRYTDEADNNEKQRRFVAPLPKSELENR